MSTFGFNSGYVEDLYAQFLQNPASVSESWREFFADYEPRRASPDKQNTDSASNAPEAVVVTAEEGVGSGDGSASSAPPAPKQQARLAQDKPAPTGKSAAARAPLSVPEGSSRQTIRGVAARIVDNMEASLEIPTATSARQVPVKLMAENRRLVNDFQRTVGGDKVSFTHLIAYALVQALREVEGMKASFRHEPESGQPERIEASQVNLGLAIDIEKNGKRQLLVPNIKGADKLTFADFLAAYNDVVRRAREAKLEVDDFQGTTATLTNPGMIGTVMSVPRLMPGQGVILAVGSIGYPPEYAALPASELSKLGLSEVMTVTSTYDHRVIQGAESGEFLAYVDELIRGKHSFYERVFASLGLNLPPLRLTPDSTPALGALIGDTEEIQKIQKQARVLQLIRAYRVRGHLVADINPLGNEARQHRELDPAAYGLTIWDLDRLFVTGELGTSGGHLAGKDSLPLRDILDVLWDTYTRKIGVEFMHISSPEEKRWLIERIEPERFKSPISGEHRHRVLEKLNAAEAFEQFIHTRYIGHKRFSLEGGETAIPILDQILSDAADQEVDEVVIGMAHRGRLNILANVVGKPLAEIFSEFEGTVDPGSVHGSGDVKYHLGATGTHKAPSGATVKVSLASNPSHLEAVNPVVEGIVRAKQQVIAYESGQPEMVLLDRVVPVLIHGDAAFAGQGVVAETLNLSALEGYKTGGTVHLVINNQIGFTTLPMHARSSVYATDIARMIQAPIFHVNGDDPEACVRVARLALDYRQVFNKDVVIDLVCYRKHGHNEGDEPSYTQPLMYERIKGHRSIRKTYMELLLRRGEITPEQAEQMLDDFRQRLDGAFEETRETAKREQEVIRRPAHADPDEPVDTSASPEDLEKVMRSLVDLPERFNVHKKLGRVIARREDAFRDGKIDWAFAESLAFGTLLLDGHPVRLSGQDSGRGTFSQRHAILYNQQDGTRYIPLNSLQTADGKRAAQFQVWDSLLSEYAVVGFEYGYSVAQPGTLVLWEAQFGDFINGAQIMIDQFISSAEAKWDQTSSLVLLLPHGYEGQGPEHSSARLERFLQSAAEDNMVVANYSTPANYFHGLRRQLMRSVRKPLVVMTPKSLLRHPRAVSSIEDLAEGRYQPVIPSSTPPETADRLVLCSGKVYYDLLQARSEADLDGRVAITRLEQFYPFPGRAMREQLKRFAGKPVVWLQEEPANMGAWTFAQPRLQELLDEIGGGRIAYAGRKASASPATGSPRRHAAEQEQLLKTALGTNADVSEAASANIVEEKPA
ncbi:multifunctional oxoglutarate decarboxylase/oxoglutarate dehydrogenase thiamine pyrophosphate-binding subunit/dihydrolipoyllysine-residue succinyltransferase subunit [soil metagenome]